MAVSADNVIHLNNLGRRGEVYMLLCAVFTRRTFSIALR
jgi:hypothetical protein